MQSHQILDNTNYEFIRFSLLLNMKVVKFSKSKFKWNFRIILNQLCRGSFYRDGKRSILGMLTPADFQGGQWGYEFQNEWSRCRRHTACRFTVVLRVIKSEHQGFEIHGLKECGPWRCTVFNWFSKHLRYMDFGQKP